jgi:hypothetical protein
MKRKFYSRNRRVKSKISPNNFFPKNRRGQVWVETVIYLLIAFVMMGLVLSFIRPKIEELRDKAIIEQSLEIIKDIDNLIVTIGSPGNKRLIEIGVRKGELVINSIDDKVTFKMDSRYMYTEPGKIVDIGNIQALTTENGKNSIITLERDFSAEYNITYEGEEIIKTLAKVSAPYRIFLTNEGTSSNKIVINFDTE